MVKQGQYKNFDKLLLEAIDEDLFSLGEVVRASIYIHLEGSFNIKKKEIPRELSDFSSALEQIFGLGARYLEILFMKNIHAKLEVTCKWPTYRYPLSKWIVTEMTFQEFVGLVRRGFEAAYSEKLKMGV